MLATGGVARGTAQYRFPCCYPLRRCAQLAEKEGPAGEGRSREKTTEFVDGRRYCGVGEICGIITLQMEIQLKDNFPRLIQGIRGWDLGTREREKRWEFGKVKLRVVNRCATLQPHTAFSRTSLRNSKLSTTLLYRTTYGVYILVVVCVRPLKRQ